MSPTLSSLLARSCLENNLRKSSVLLPLALYIKYTNGRPVRCECSRRGIGQKVWHERLHHHSAHSLLHRLYHAFDGKHVARGFAARVTRQQDVAMHSTQQCVKDGTVTEKHNQTPHVTGRNRLERAKVLEQQKSVSPSTQTSGTNLTTLNRDLSHVTHPTYTPKTLPSWEADASFFKWHKNYTIYFREPFSWKLDRCWIFGFINIVKNGRIK